VKEQCPNGCYDGACIDPCEGADINENGRVDLTDFIILRNNWGKSSCGGLNDSCQGADINENGRVDLTDFVILRNNYGEENCTSYGAGGGATGYAIKNIGEGKGLIARIIVWFRGY